MLKLACHCGDVRIEVEKRPAFVNECNCSLCRKAGARWAYFDPSEVKVEGEVRDYRRKDKNDPAAEVHFCARCGTTTHFTLTPSAVAKFGSGLVGVNMQLAEEVDLAGIELRFPDGRAWSGEGDFRYVREARVFGDRAPFE